MYRYFKNKHNYELLKCNCKVSIEVRETIKDYEDFLGPESEHNPKSDLECLNKIKPYYEFYILDFKLSYHQIKYYTKTAYEYNIVSRNNYIALNMKSLKLVLSRLGRRDKIHFIYGLIMEYGLRRIKNYIFKNYYYERFLSNYCYYDEEDNKDYLPLVYFIVKNQLENLKYIIKKYKVTEINIDLNYVNSLGVINFLIKKFKFKGEDFKNCILKIKYSDYIKN